MNCLIIKLGATGDVVRTTPLLNVLNGQIAWLTAAKNSVLIEDLKDNVRCVSWEERDALRDRNYDLVINIEDTLDVGAWVKALDFKQLWGAYADSENRMRYTDDSRQWFDLSIISRHGKDQADRLKFENRRTYQDLAFDGLGFRFAGEPYLLAEPIETELSGDIAIAADAGPVWPMKKWAYYDELKRRLEDQGLTVNVLPKRSSLLEHLADVRNHRCLVGGDTLPMHLALGAQTPCVTLFTCTSPWEIHGYGLQEKIISPLLGEFFYRREYDIRATTAISLDEVLRAVIGRFDTSGRG